MFITHIWLGQTIRRLLLLVIAIATLSLAVPAAGAAAEGKVGGSNVKVAISPGGGEEIRVARRAVLLFSGTDSLRTKVMEDVLALELINAGLEVVSRSRLETLIAEKLAEGTPPTPAKEGAEQKPEPARRPLEPVGAVQVAKAAGAQVVLIGTMLDERQRSALVGTGRPGQLLDQPIVVVTASIQVVDVQTNSILMVLVGCWPNGTSIPEAAEELAKPLKEKTNP